jgi:NADH dehydrogenase
LREDGHELACLVRDRTGEGSEYLKGLGAELFEGNVLDAGSLAAAAAGTQAVVHLVGIIFERRGHSFEQVHLQGTRNVLAAAAQAGASRFIFMSALGTGPDAETGYHRTKWAAEEAVRQSGIDYTIFRPSIIYGRGGEFIHMLAGMIRVLPLIPVIGDGRYLMQPIAVGDVAACFAASLTSAKTAGQTYEIGGPEQLSYNAMIDTLCLHLGKSRFKMYTPVALVKPVAWLSQRLQKKPFLTMDQLKMLLADNVCDITRMKEDLGVDPVAFSEGLRGVVTEG